VGSGHGSRGTDAHRTFRVGRFRSVQYRLAGFWLSGGWIPISSFGGSMTESSLAADALDEKIGLSSLRKAYLMVHRTHGRSSFGGWTTILSNSRPSKRSFSRNLTRPGLLQEIMSGKRRSRPRKTCRKLTSASERHNHARQRTAWFLDKDSGLQLFSAVRVLAK